MVTINISATKTDHQLWNKPAIERNVQSLSTGSTWQEGHPGSICPQEGEFLKQSLKGGDWVTPAMEKE